MADPPAADPPMAVAPLAGPPVARAAEVAAAGLDRSTPVARVDALVAAGRADPDARVRAAALAKALSDHALTIKSAVKGGASLGAYGITSFVGRMTRDGGLPDAPASAMTMVFALNPGDVALVEEPGFTALVQVNAVSPAPADGEDATALREAIEGNSRRAMAQDVFTLFTEALTTEAGIALDQTAINAVIVQFN